MEAVVEEYLRDDEIHAGAHLGGKVLHVERQVATLGMALGIARTGQAQTIAVPLPDKSHQIRGVREAVGRRHEVVHASGRITS